VLADGINGRDVGMFTAKVGAVAVVRMEPKAGTVRMGASATGSEDVAGGVTGSCGGAEVLLRRPSSEAVKFAGGSLISDITMVPPRITIPMWMIRETVKNRDSAAFS
jgi:CxxC motif-containing protein (DUF1111 family)